MTEGEQTLEGMDRTTKFSFVGIKYESLKTDLQIGQEVEFKVRGRVVGAGDEEMSDGMLRHVLKVSVASVVPLSFEEPADPSVQVLDEDGGLFSDDDADKADG